MSGFSIIVIVICLLILRHYYSLRVVEAQRRFIIKVGFDTVNYHSRIENTDGDSTTGIDWVVSNNTENSLSVWDD